MTKLVVIIAISGNQGSSVANAFPKDDGWKIRGVTRDPSKPASKALAGKGIDIVKGDVDDVDSIKAAVQGASIVYGNIAFSEAFSNPAVAHVAKLSQGQTLREWCYEKELQRSRGKISPPPLPQQEMAEMYAYAQDFGYDGGDPSVITVQQLSFDVSVTRIEQYIRDEDWPPLLFTEDV
ncbi:hypothetical protein V491_07517 [Pseudogymnoascus sp. VKM F-3775]|nr:hypothetical protein V491_07517 [Pseudogymnoascus sp. VKM F-3775]